MTSGREFRKRQRGKNIALALVLLAMVVLFFAISIVQMSRGAAS